MHAVKSPAGSPTASLSYKLIDLIIRITCTAGTIVQVYESSVDYFNYPVDTEIKRLSPPQMMPAVTVCPNWYRSPLYNKNLTKLPVSKRYEMYGDESSYIEWCKIRLANESIVDCPSVTSTSNYVGIFGACFSYFQTGDLKVNASDLTYDETTSDDKFVLQMKVKSPFVSPQRWAMRVNPPDEPFLFARRQRSKIYFEPRLNTKITFNLQVFRIYRLKYPYSSGCFDYSETVHKVRDKASYDCLIKNYRNKTTGAGYWFPFSYVKWKHEFYNETQYYKEEADAQKISLFPGVNAYCQRKYHLQECESTFYTLKIKSVHRGNQNNTSIVLQINNLPAYEEIKVTREWMSFIDYINKCGGTLSLWFNFAVYTFSCKMCKAFASVMRRYYGMKERKKKKRMKSAKKKSEKLPAVMKLVDLLVRLTCMIGCIYQSFDIMSKFLDDNFYFWISSRRPEFVYMPRLTLCLDSPLYDKDANEYLSDSESEQLRFTKSIHQLFPMTMNISQIFLNSSLYLNQETMSTRPLSNYYRFEKRLTDRFVCFTTFGKEHYIGNSSYQPYEDEQLSTAFMFKIYLKFMNSSHVKSLRIYSHFEKTFNMDATSTESYIVINSHAKLTPNLYYWASNEFRVRLVNSGTRINCFNYSSINYPSRTDAINHCVNKMMRQKYSLCPHDVPINETEGENMFFARNRSLELQLYNQCMKQYHLIPCDLLIRKLELVNTGFFDKSFQLVLYPSDDDYKELKQEIRLTFTELIVYIGGAIGSWLGLAVIDLLPLSLKVKSFIQTIHSRLDESKQSKLKRKMIRRERAMQVCNCQFNVPSQFIFSEHQLKI